MTLQEILALDESCAGCPVCKPRPRSKGYPWGFPRGAAGDRPGPSRAARKNRHRGGSRKAA